MQSIENAIIFATKAHAGAVRKGNLLPYIVHPIEVLKLVADWGVKPFDVLMAAVCHDVKEENPILARELPKVIGDSATQIVEELTFYPQRQIKDDYIKSFDTKSIAALVVKIADRNCNTRDFAAMNDDYAAKYWYKADPLFQMFHVRRKEIDQTFGEQVALNISRAIGATTALVERRKSN